MYTHTCFGISRVFRVHVCMSGAAAVQGRYAAALAVFQRCTYRFACTSNMQCGRRRSSLAESRKGKGGKKNKIDFSSPIFTPTRLHLERFDCDWGVWLTLSCFKGGVLLCCTQHAKKEVEEKREKNEKHHFQSLASPDSLGRCLDRDLVETPNCSLFRRNVARRCTTTTHFLPNKQLTNYIPDCLKLSDARLLCSMRCG